MIRNHAIGAVLVLGTALCSQAPCGQPHLVGTPLPAGTVDARLQDVFALSPNDLWAVGHFGQTVQGQLQTLSWIVHWDGQRFARVPSPSPGIVNYGTWCELHAVGGAAADDLWAAGLYNRQFPNNGHIGPQILLLHWDGATWSQVPEPLPQFTYTASASGTRIDEIIAFATDDVWFFGWWPGDQFSGAGPLTLHWNGDSMRVVDIASLPNNNSRWRWIDVDALSRNVFWGVATTGGGNFATYVARWNGASWTRATLPTLPVTYYDLTAVGSIADNDVWVGGAEMPLSPSSIAPYTIHWNGSSWARIPTRGYVNEFVAFGSADVWAFGTTIEHWDGTAWRLVEDFGATLASAQGLEAIATGACDLWTVGAQWASANGPPVLPLVARVGSGAGGPATLHLPCVATPLRQSLLPLDTPAIGRTLRVAIDDPAGVGGWASPGTTVLVFGAGPAPVCGQLLAGFGPRGTVGEWLVPAPFLVVGAPSSWLGAGQLAEHAIALPADPAFLGVPVAAQAAIADARGRVGLTSGLDLVVGQ